MKQLGRRPAKKGTGTIAERLKRVFTGLLWLIKTVLLSPFYLVRAIRETMTVASVSVMLITLMTLNIIWGYPWTGMMAACIAVLTIGWVCNQIMRPKLSVGCSLPASSPLGQPLRLVAHLQNDRRLPALDISLGFQDVRKQRRHSSSPTFVSSAWDFFSLIRPHGNVDHNAALTFDRRGIHKIPPLTIVSTFPFYLFRTSSRASLDATIAITPKPLNAEQDVAAKNLLSTIGGWAHKLLAGTAVEYTGSREYQVGMPVRRWDFASWARLGRPIVREYESPSVCAISLLIDTAKPELTQSNRRKRRRQKYDPQFERMLSLAASAIAEFANRSIHINLYLTHEPTSVIVNDNADQSASRDRESMLIRLAQAYQVDVETSQSRFDEVLDHIGNQPTLILTCRKESDFSCDFPSGVSIIPVESGVQA